MNLFPLFVLDDVAGLGIPSVRRVPTPVLDRFRDVRRTDGLGTRQVRDGARNLQDTVEGPRRERQLRHGHLEQSCGFVRKAGLAKFADVARRHGGIGARSVRAEASPLQASRLTDPIAHDAGCFGKRVIGELLVIDTRNLDEEINAIHEGTADPPLVVLDAAFRAGAGGQWVAIVATGAPVRVLTTTPFDGWWPCDDSTEPLRRSPLPSVWLLPCGNELILPRCLP